MEELTLCTGQKLREVFEAAGDLLEKNARDIDSLNVFPVPDGDCGTNMMLTVRSAVEEARHAPDHSASAVAKAMARGALMGARGNSGVILSQIFRGIAQGVEDKEFFNGADFAAGLVEGTAFAYKALANPVEGTILTVAREASEAARSTSAQSDDLICIVEAVVSAAKDSVASTPMLLPVLREAGVVDAGGQGFYVIMEGVLGALKKEGYRCTEKGVVRYERSSMNKVPLLAMGRSENLYGYCTELVLDGSNLNLDDIRKELEKRGQSVIVAGDECIAHIHIHTFDPGSVLSYATFLGTLHTVKIENMDDQHRVFSERTTTETFPSNVAIIAVAAGEGMKEVFQGLGITAVVSGGAAMNPSTQELLLAVESVPQDKVILLPNDKNVIPVAIQVPHLTAKEVAVVPTESVPQGVAASLSFNCEGDLQSNVEGMSRAKSAVKTVEVTRAVRDTLIGNLQVTEGQAIVFVDGEIAIAGDSPSLALEEALQALISDEIEIATIYYRDRGDSKEAEEVSQRIRQMYPHLQVDLIFGGQPYYHYIASVE